MGECRVIRVRVEDLPFTTAREIRTGVVSSKFGSDRRGRGRRDYGACREPCVSLRVHGRPPAFLLTFPVESEDVDS